MPKILQCTVMVFVMIPRLHLIYGEELDLISTYEVILMRVLAFTFIALFVWLPIHTGT